MLQAPLISYVLCCLPRTGSWLLTEGLSMTQVAGRPDEYFAPGRELDMGNSNADGSTPSFADYVAWVVENATTPNGVAGFKVHTDQLQYLAFRWQLLANGRDLTLPQVIDDIFPHARWIYCRRNDKVRQAVSWWRSLQTQQWFEIDNQPIAPLTSEPKYHFDEIATLHHRILSEESTWREFFAAVGAVPLVVEYEKLAASYEATVTAVLHHIGLAGQAPAALPPPRLRPQSDALNEEWVNRYCLEATSDIA